MLSLVVPVYKNEMNLDCLLAELSELRRKMRMALEVVFVIDGSPDRSEEILRQRLPTAPFASKLVSLSRNFGAFSAIAAGMEAGAGDYFAVLAADLQEPPELVLEFEEILSSGAADVVFGCRSRRSDPWLSSVFSQLFWWIYRTFIIRDMPRGGVDVFGCTRRVWEQVLRCPESKSNLIALLFWVGFRRRYAMYERRARKEGKSAWTIRKKIRYSLDSIFNYTELPIQLLLIVGAAGVTVAVLFATVLIVLKLAGDIPVSGYSAIVVAIMFFGALTSLGLGIVGQYLWLTLQNARSRPNYIVASEVSFRNHSASIAGAGKDRER